MAAIKSAETVYFEARKLHTTGVVPKMYEELKSPTPVTLQTYSSCDSGGVAYVRVESSVAFGESSLTSLFIKDRDGIWDVLPHRVVEVSAIFRHDNLMGTFPFLRLLSILQHPYELSIDESPGSRGQLIVKGRLATKPLQCEQDIARDFCYAINTNNGHLCSLREETFAGRLLHLVFEHFEVNSPMDRRIFELPNREKMMMSSLEQYINIRNHEWAKMMLNG